MNYQSFSEVIQKALQSSLVKRSLLDPPYKILIPDPPSARERVQELPFISHQYKNRHNPESMQELLDEKPQLLFDFVLVNAGKGSHKELIDKMNKDTLPIILFHKKHFMQPRPHELAQQAGIDFSYDELDTTNTRSYPSGHTTQAFYIAMKLAKMYPDLEKRLITVAHMIAESRIDRGVHFPSDNEAGKILAAKLLGLDADALLRSFQLDSCDLTIAKSVCIEWSNSVERTTEAAGLSFSSVIQKSKYTKPKLRERLKAKIMAGSKGGKPGQWSARKAQLLAQEYEKAGGGYRGRRSKKQKDLKTWTKQDWQTPSGKTSRESGEVYAPKRTISALRSTKQGRKKLKEATKIKRRATKQGKQFARHGLHEGKTRKGPGVDERVWSQAKKLAEQSGQSDNWPYVMTIYKRLKGEDIKTAGRYDHIDFKPPRSVANAAKMGLKLRRKASPSNRGGLTTEEAAEQGIGSGVQRAVDLKNRRKMSPETIKRMLSFFARHEKNKAVGEGKQPHEDKGYVSWLLWGGDPGRSWAKRIKARMDRADKDTK